MGRTTPLSYDKNHTSALRLSDESREAITKRFTYRHNEELNKQIQEHASRRIDLLFILMIVYYQSNKELKVLPAEMQYGSSKGDLAACHSSITPTINDPELKKTHFYQTLNACVELPLQVNQIDLVLETKLRKEVEILLNQVSQGRLTPIDAMNQFMVKIDFQLRRLKTEYQADPQYALKAYFIDFIIQGTFERHCYGETRNLTWKYIFFILKINNDENVPAAYQAIKEDVFHHIQHPQSQPVQPINPKRPAMQDDTNKSRFERLVKPILDNEPGAFITLTGLTPQEYHQIKGSFGTGLGNITRSGLDSNQYLIALIIQKRFHVKEPENIRLFFTPKTKSKDSGDNFLTYTQKALDKVPNPTRERIAGIINQGHFKTTFASLEEIIAFCQNNPNLAEIPRELHSTSAKAQAGERSAERQRATPPTTPVHAQRNVTSALPPKDKEEASASGETDEPPQFNMPNFAAANTPVGLFDGKTKNQQQKRRLLLAAIHNGFSLGKALSKGDCFFDACAQTLNRIFGTNMHTVKSLRLLCHQYAVTLDARCEANPQHNSNWIGKLFNDGQRYQEYLANIQFTAQEREAGAGLGTDQLAVWGEPHIDGRIICQQLNVKLHVIEVRENPDPDAPQAEKIIVGHNLITSTGLRNVGAEGINWQDPRLIHIAILADGIHFVPVLRHVAAQHTKPGFFANTSSVSRKPDVVKLPTDGQQQSIDLTIASAFFGITQAVLSDPTVSLTVKGHFIADLILQVQRSSHPMTSQSLPRRSVNLPSTQKFEQSQSAAIDGFAAILDALATNNLAYLQNADFTIQNSNGETILDKVIKNGNLEFLKILQQVGLDFDDAQMSSSTEPPLVQAAQCGNLAVATFLLDQGLDVEGGMVLPVEPTEEERADSLTPLHAAIQNGHWQLVELFLKRGASPFVKNPDGYDPLQALFSYSADSQAIFRMLCALIEAGLEIPQYLNADEAIDILADCLEDYQTKPDPYKLNTLLVIATCRGVIVHEAINSFEASQFENLSAAIKQQLLLECINAMANRPSMQNC